MLTEIALGRMAQSTPLTGYAKLSNSNLWSGIGWLGVTASILIMSYYVMILAWIVVYIRESIAGNIAKIATPNLSNHFNTLASDIPIILLVILGIMFLASLIVRKGLKAGLERYSKFMKATGHPVFWLKPVDPKLFTPPNFSVFAADISNSGWYGFPYLPHLGVVKIAKHTNGIEIHPEKEDRQIRDEEVRDMRNFIAMTFPTLLNAPLVFTRRCLYNCLLYTSPSPRDRG